MTYVGACKAFDGNELCQESPYLNDATAGLPLSLSIGGNFKFRGIQSFHPTIAGQSVLAQKVFPAVPFPTS